MRCSQSNELRIGVTAECEQYKSNNIIKSETHNANEDLRIWEHSPSTKQISTVYNADDMKTNQVGASAVHRAANFIKQNK